MAGELRDGTGDAEETHEVPVGVGTAPRGSADALTDRPKDSARVVYARVSTALRRDAA